MLCFSSIRESNLSFLIAFIKGVVDTQKEVAKLESQKEKLVSQQSKLKEKMEVEGYEEKVPESVRNANAEKVGG